MTHSYPYRRDRVTGLTTATEDQIERAVERKFNMLDRRLMSGDIAQGEYNELAKCINAWAESEYDQLRALAWNSFPRTGEAAYRWGR